MRLQVEYCTISINLSATVSLWRMMHLTKFWFRQVLRWAWQVQISSDSHFLHWQIMPWPEGAQWWHWESDPAGIVVAQTTIAGLEVRFELLFKGSCHDIAGRIFFIMPDIFQTYMWQSRWTTTVHSSYSNPFLLPSSLTIFNTRGYRDLKKRPGVNFFFGPISLD